VQKWKIAIGFPGKYSLLQFSYGHEGCGVLPQLH